MAVTLALLASLTWGVSDFLGGVAARRLAATAVVAVSQGLALVALVVIAALTGGFGASPGYLGWAVAAGFLSAAALTAFYAALAGGTMGVVAPIAATGTAVPVIVGLALGDRPSLAQDAGLLAALLGVVLASGPESRAARRRPLALAVIAALGFGAVIIVIARGAKTDVLMTILVMRAVSVGLLGALSVAGRAEIRAGRADLPLLAAVGAGDVGANAMFALASTHGLLSLVAVLSSLYPAVTVLLARFFYAERMRPVQNVGVVAAIAGIVLIAAG